MTFDGMGVMVSFFRRRNFMAPLLGALCFALNATAQDVADHSAATFFIRSWQNQQGLPNNTVNAVIQGHDGYLWLGTHEGLARFDGVRCEIFGLQAGLKNLQVSALLEDRQGGLWIGTSGGGVGRMIGGEIKTYTASEGLAGDSISSFVEATNGDVWIGTHTGLSRWHAGRFEPVAKELGPMLVFDLAIDHAGDIWAATLHNGLLRFHGEKYSVADGETGSITNNPRCVFVDRQDRVWAGLRERKMVCFDGGKWISYGTNEGFPEVVTYRVAETADGTIWAGSWNEGLYYFQAGRFNALQKKDGLSDDAVLSLHAGGGRFLWVGTQSGGLNRIGPKILSVDHLMDGASECQVRSLAQTTNGELWAGTYGQGLYRWQGQLAVPLLADRLREHLLVEAVLSGRDGSLWWGAGPSLYQWRQEKLLARFSDTPWLIGDRVWSLCEDRDDGLWVGTYNGKLGLLKNGKFMPVNGLSGKPITSLVQAPDGTLWIGSLGGGLVRLQNQKLTSFTAQDGLQSNLVRALHLDADGTLWIGTDGGGLNRWSHERMSGFTTQQGLLDDIVLQILEDDDGSLWLGCNRGICRVSKPVLNDVAIGKSVSVHAVNFGVSEGMSSAECVGSFGGAIKTSAGQLRFATAKGVVVINPRQQNHLAAVPVALIESVRVDKQIWGFVSRTNNISGDNNFSDPAMTIPPGKHAFEFHYTGIGFDAPEKIQFRYLVDPLDSGWNEAGDLRVAGYGYIPPGTYRFHVQACNLSGQWNEPGATVSFVVLAHFWQTLWFKALLVLGGIILIAVGIRRLERRRYRARLKRIEQERAIETERVRIARDLHDELGSSLTYISMSITDIGQSGENDAERLKSRVGKISGFAVRTARALDEIVWAVNPRNDSLRSLVEYLTQVARELFENTGVKCRFQIAHDLPAVPLPPEMRHNLFLVVKEALNNALKHSHATEVSLSAKTDGQRIEIGLQDNGAGFDLATPPLDSESNGLKNMRQRIEALGGQFIILSRLGQGTTIKLLVNFPCSDTPETKSQVD